MNEVESIFIYGFAGYIVLTQVNGMILGIYLSFQGEHAGYVGDHQVVFFAWKALALVAGVALAIAYFSGLGFLWSMLLFSLLSAPEPLWIMWRDFKAKKAAVADQPVEIAKERFEEDRP